MSNLALNWAWAQKIGRMGTKFTLVACADFASSTGSCWMSQATLAGMTSQGERTVRRQLDWLEKSGFLKRTKRLGATGRHLTDMVQLSRSADEFLPAAKLETDERRTTGQRRTIQRPNADLTGGQAVAADPKDLIPDQNHMMESSPQSQPPENLALTPWKPGFLTEIACLTGGRPESASHERRKHRPCSHGKCPQGGPCRYVISNE